MIPPFDEFADDMHACPDCNKSCECPHGADDINECVHCRIEDDLDPLEVWE